MFGKLKRTSDEATASDLEKINYTNQMPKTMDYCSRKERRASLEKLIAAYPKLEQIREAANNPFEKQLTHQKHSYSSSEIRPGDICHDISYSISIPLEDTLLNLFNTYLGESSASGLDRVKERTSAVFKTVKHCNHLALTFEAQSLICESMFKFYHNKIIPLEKILSNELPSVCFGKAVALATALSVDKELSGLGIRAYLSVGCLLKGYYGLSSKHMIERNYYADPHAWVTLKVPHGLEKLGFLNEIYILDPSFGEIFLIDNSKARPPCKYIEEKDSKYSYILRPKLV